MRIYLWFLAAAIMLSILCSIIVNPEGEGFVRGYNVAFTFFITSIIVWLMTLPPLCFLARKWISLRSFAPAVRQHPQITLFSLTGILTPLLNGLIIRLKSVLETHGVL